MSGYTHPTASEEADYARMLHEEPLYDVVRRINAWSVELKSRGTGKLTVWVIGRGRVRKPHECVVCRHVFRPPVSALEAPAPRMYRPPMAFEAPEMRVCERCAAV